ncbi:MAG TPA: Crp/Fnr family transcriptional regulator [Coleofasciculaceae cyanobacterium]|jgi:CRP-like cAMP-binding protein
MSKVRRNLIKNRLLSALPREEYDRLLPNLETVSLSFQQIIYAPNEPIEYIYFPSSGIVSLVNVLKDGGTVEAATVGNEGMVGIPVLLGSDSMSGQAVVQVTGDALRMKADVFKRQVTPGSPLHNLLLRYTLALINLISQSVACNARHSVEQRACRWLLMCQDRVQSNQFYLTQEFLSQMLGVRRASVSVVAAILQRAGLIRYSRGKITVLDSPGLEAASCECYQIVKQEFDRLLSCLE